MVRRGGVLLREDIDHSKTPTLCLSSKGVKAPKENWDRSAKACEHQAEGSALSLGTEGLSCSWRTHSTHTGGFGDTFPGVDKLFGH